MHFAPINTSGRRSPGPDKIIAKRDVVGRRPELGATVVGKRARSYDDQDRAQRGFGAATALAVGGGALLARRGVKNIRQASSLSRKLADGARIHSDEALKDVAEHRQGMLASRGITGTRGDFARVGGGGALIISGGAINRHAKGNGGRRRT